MEKNTCIRLLSNPEQIEGCRSDLKESQSLFAKFSDVYALVGNEVRLKIVYLLQQEKELCPCDLSDILEMTNSAVSQHLKKLKEGGLLHTRKKGQTIFYSLTQEGLKLLTPVFHQFLVLTQQPEAV